MSDPDTLKAGFDALQAERQRSWSAEQLEANRAQRQALVERFDPARIAQPGSRLPPFDLIDVDGGHISLDVLVRTGPAVLVFFRFATCPACNISLPYYDRRLRPALERASIPLIAVSPQTPQRLRAIKDRHGLRLRVATDPDNRLARHLGITFVPDQRDTIPPKGWIGEVTGTNSWELPQPTVLCIGKNGIVRSIIVSPDWLDRPEADEVLETMNVEANAVA